MDRGDTTQGLGNPGENIDSYFHPLPGSLSPRQTWQAIEVADKFASILGNGKAIWRIRVKSAREQRRGLQRRPLCLLFRPRHLARLRDFSRFCRAAPLLPSARPAAREATLARYRLA